MDAAAVHLCDRGIVEVTGKDAAKLLQDLITNDMQNLDTAPAIYSGLLSPQAKILFDFFVVAFRDGFLLDVARDKADDLAGRLNLYKLRSQARINNVSDTFAVFAGPKRDTLEATFVTFADPRLPELGWRTIAGIEADASAMAVRDQSAQALYDRYHRHRITLGVPEGGKDYAFGDAYPHEALFDQLDGISFTKGCYIGQEVVSRTQHRRAARKRIVPISGGATLPPTGTEITAGLAIIGRLGSTSDTRGLALVRLDRVREQRDKGFDLMAGEVAVTIDLPTWARFEIPEPTAQPSAD